MRGGGPLLPGRSNSSLPDDHGISFHLTSIGDIKSPSYTMLPSSGFRGFARTAFLPRVLLELKGEI
jgi:hypothetical protein